MTKLRYFYKKTICNKTKYIWQPNPNVAKKYDVIKFESLGYDFTKAIKRWQELDNMLNKNKEYYP